MAAHLLSGCSWAMQEPAIPDKVKPSARVAIQGIKPCPEYCAQKELADEIFTCNSSLILPQAYSLSACRSWMTHR